MRDPHYRRPYPDPPEQPRRVLYRSVWAGKPQFRRSGAGSGRCPRGGSTAAGARPSAAGRVAAASAPVRSEAFEQVQRLRGGGDLDLAVVPDVRAAGDQTGGIHYPQQVADQRAGACSHWGSAARSRRHRGTWQPPQALQGLRGPWPDARSMEDRNISMTTSMDQSKLSVIFRKQVIDCRSLLSTYSPAIDLPVTKTTPSAGHTRSSGTSARACPERRAWASVIGTASRTSEPPPSPRSARRSNIRVGACTTQISDTQRADTSRKASAPCRQ